MFAKEKAWRLDFAKGTISVEVAFNHGEATAWNFMKPTLASEVNHVEKESRLMPESSSQSRRP